MISKITVKGVTHDIKDTGARELIESLQENVDGVIVPTKISELENDSNFLDKNANYNLISGRTHFYNAHESGNGKTRIDIAVGNIQGAESGGSAGDLYLNRNSTEDVYILDNGTGTLYYKGNEVADRYYVDEQIANIEIPDTHTHDNKDILDSISQEDINKWNSGTGGSGGSAYELPIASSETLGGVKIGANLSIDSDGTLNANGSIEDIIYGDYVSEIIIGYILENSVKVPVYRKIFKGDKVAGSNLVFDTTSLNIGKVLNVQGSTDRGNLVYPLMRYESSDNYTYVYFTPNTNQLVFTSGTSTWCATGSVTIILEYLKK